MTLALPKGSLSFAAFILVLFTLFLYLPPIDVQDGAGAFIFTIGALALWRYSWGLTHFVRALFYQHVTFPRWRKRIDDSAENLMPSKIYMLLTTYRIEPNVTYKVVNAAINEAIDSDLPCTIVASVVEMADELAYRQIFEELMPPDRVELRIIRIAGQGKRSALAQGFKAISRDMPEDDALVVVIDGDTALTQGSLRQCAPFFKTHPKLGGLTTDETPSATQSALANDWYSLRFSQRHMQMSSLSLSKRVMTLTGRMSIYRADIVTHPAFIDHMLNDSLDHWRLGRFKFLTGDDKSSLFWVLKQGFEQIYVPDVQVLAMERLPEASFVKSSIRLMKRWYGNMLRTNARILKLGPWAMPFFVWWSFLDQRVSIWTALAGPTIAIMLTVQYGWIVLAYYLVWVAFVRTIMSLMLLTSRYEISWRYPFLLYYGQVVGAFVKTYVLFRMDQQSWTRQKIESDTFSAKPIGSLVMHSLSLLIFVCVLGVATNVLALPYPALRSFF